MGRAVDFVITLDDGVRKRHRHQTENGKLTYFAVQLEALVCARWEPIIRYDCSHGHSHVHKYDIMGREMKKMVNLNFESALTFSDWDIEKNWQRYVQQFHGGKR